MVRPRQRTTLTVPTPSTVDARSIYLRRERETGSWTDDERTQGAPPRPLGGNARHPGIHEQGRSPQVADPLGGGLRDLARRDLLVLPPQRVRVDGAVPRPPDPRPAAPVEPLRHGEHGDRDAVGDVG